VLDTKAFSMNTGSGTFDAAAFLRRAGADAASVKRLLQTDIEIATARYELMRTAEIYKPGIAIAKSYEPQNRISIAQAADELLSIKDVHTSFAIAQDGETVYVSGRSIGNINVQVILEKLGGGGSQATAGLQVQGESVEHVVGALKKTINEYKVEG
jgi:c-di-AMP phosphodiesterase-like protein